MEDPGPVILTAPSPQLSPVQGSFSEISSFEGFEQRSLSKVYAQFQKVSDMLSKVIARGDKPTSVLELPNIATIGDTEDERIPREI